MAKSQLVGSDYQAESDFLTQLNYNSDVYQYLPEREVETEILKAKSIFG